MTDLNACLELETVIREEQQHSSGLKVSQQLTSLVMFIIEVINCEVRKEPVFEVADSTVVRNLEFFPHRPIIRKQVLYEKDQKHGTQIEWVFANQLNAQQ